MNFAVSDSISHHDVSGGVRAREEILNLLAGVNVPVGNVVGFEVVNVFGFDAASFANSLHRLEGLERVDAVMNQIHHDIVAGGNGVLQRARALTNQILRVAEPNVGAVRKARNSHEVAETIGVRVVNHLPRETRAKFRQPECSRLRSELLRRQVERVG